MKRVKMKKQQIKTNLTNILSQLNELLVLLHTEKSALSDSAFDSLSVIAQQKKQIITAIEVHDTKLKMLLHTEKHSNTEQSIHDIILENIPDCSSLWLDIEKTLKTCKSKNTVNGIILSNNRRQIRENLAILLGQPNQILLYGASGESVATNTILDSSISA